MAAEGRYRRSPARAVEAFAVEVVRAWVAEAGVVTDTSGAHGRDFLVAYSDGRSAVGEVGWHADPLVEAMWARTFRERRHQVVELPDGLGQWSVQLVLGANTVTRCVVVLDPLPLTVRRIGPFFRRG